MPSSASSFLRGKDNCNIASNNWCKRQCRRDISVMSNAKRDCQRSPRFCHWVIEDRTFHVCVLVSPTIPDHLGTNNRCEYMAVYRSFVSRPVRTRANMLVCPMLVVFAIFNYECICICKHNSAAFVYMPVHVPKQECQCECASNS